MCSNLQMHDCVVPFIGKIEYYFHGCIISSLWLMRWRRCLRLEGEEKRLNILSLGLEREACRALMKWCNNRLTSALSIPGTVVFINFPTTLTSVQRKIIVTLYFLTIIHYTSVLKLGAQSGTHTVTAQSGTHTVTAQSGTHTVTTHTHYPVRYPYCHCPVRYPYCHCPVRYPYCHYYVTAQSGTHTVTAQSGTHTVTTQSGTHTVTAQSGTHMSLAAVAGMCLTCSVFDRVGHELIGLFREKAAQQSTPLYLRVLD